MARFVYLLTGEIHETTETPKPNPSEKMENPINTEFFKRIIDLITFQQRFQKKNPNPTIIGNENGTHEYDLEKILKKGGRGYKYQVKWKNYIPFIWDPASIIKNIIDLNEFETNLN